MKLITPLILSTAVMLAPLLAQGRAGSTSHTAILHAQAETIRALVLRTAEKVPENLYEFKPTPAVRSPMRSFTSAAPGSPLARYKYPTGR